MTDDELIAYARGWLDGYDRGELHTMTSPPDPEEWRAIVQRWNTVSERSLQRLLWDRANKEDDHGQALERPDQQPEGRLHGQALDGSGGRDGRAA